MGWYIAVLKKYAVFEGRARRREYWIFTLISLLIYIALVAVGMATKVVVLPMIYSLAVLVPSLAVTVRRLHDIDRSGWWLLICFVPIIGAIIFLIFMVRDSQPGTNQYGENPKEGATNVATPPVKPVVPPAKAAAPPVKSVAPSAKPVASPAKTVTPPSNEKK